jgi:hypothetical protein
LSSIAAKKTIEVEPFQVSASARLLLYCGFAKDRARGQATNNIAADESASVGVMLLTGERVFFNSN